MLLKTFIIDKKLKQFKKLNLQILTLICLKSFLLSCQSIDPYSNQMDYEKKLNGISVLKQEYAYSCNLTALAIVKSSLGYSVNEESIRKYLSLEDRKRGMLPHEFVIYGNKALADTNYVLVQKNYNFRGEILDQIISSLELNLPIVMYYSTINDWDRPNYDTHYSVIYGINYPRKIVIISNSYGYIQELAFDEFFDGLSYRNYKNEPLLHQIARLVKIIRPNNLFFLTPKDSAK